MKNSPTVPGRRTTRGFSGVPADADALGAPEPDAAPGGGADADMIGGALALTAALALPAPDGFDLSLPHASDTLTPSDSAAQCILRDIMGGPKQTTEVTPLSRTRIGHTQARDRDVGALALACARPARFSGLSVSADLG